jgi:hypothetical protein
VETAALALSREESGRQAAQVAALEASVAQWRGRCEGERAARERLEAVEATLRAEVRTAKARADTAQLDLRKHRELILYINKVCVYFCCNVCFDLSDTLPFLCRGQLSAGAEGEAGKEKARRLSMKLSQEDRDADEGDEDDEAGGDGIGGEGEGEGMAVDDDDDVDHDHHEGVNAPRTSSSAKSTTAAPTAAASRPRRGKAGDPGR